MPKTHTHRRKVYYIYLSGAELRAARNQAGLSQDKLAEMLKQAGVVGMYQRKISRLETMHEFSVDYDTFKILATILPTPSN